MTALGEMFRGWAFEGKWLTTACDSNFNKEVSADWRRIEIVFLTKAYQARLKQYQNIFQKRRAQWREARLLAGVSEGIGAAGSVKLNRLAREESIK